MKRKYGAAKKNESEAERMMRERAAERKDNSHNYGSVSRKGAVSAMTRCQSASSAALGRRCRLMPSSWVRSS